MSRLNIREGARVPLLLLIPLVVVVAVLGYLLLLPLSLLQRYRAGRARRRAQAWLIGANAWMLLVSTTGFLLGAWLGERWIPGALREAVLGLLAGECERADVGGPVGGVPERDYISLHIGPRSF